MAKWREEPPRSQRWRLNLYVNGVSHKLTFYGSKKDALAHEAEQRIRLGAVPRAKSGVAMSYEDYCVEQYKPAAKVRLRKSTWKVRRYQLPHLIMHFGALKLTKILEPEIEAYKIMRREAGADIETVNTELNVLSATLSYARNVLRLPCADPKISRFKVSKSKRGNVKFYTRAEVGLILAACAEVAPRFLPLFIFLFETGARKSEAIHLPWKNVMFDQRIVRIWSEADDDVNDTDYEVKSVEREVPSSDHLVRVLAEQKLRGLSNEWVFPVVTARSGTKGAQYAEFPNNTWDRVLKRATALAREADPAARPINGGPHRARHTFASHFLAMKPDLFLLGRVLGHGHTRVTELYAHLIPEHLAAARNVVTFAAAATPKPARPEPAARATSGEPSPDHPQQAPQSEAG